MCCCIVFVFCFKQKTAYDLRISDWSSDVCSSDLDATAAFQAFVNERPVIMECYSMSGDWDYLLRVVAVDVADYERFLMRVLLGHPSVATASSHFALSQTKYITDRKSTRLNSSH